ncbi:MAG: hypothetical protein RRC34_12675 [Lentisphaeria bacterium]|nr:hypothetical protein [Lentisphaeria bacterium]
MSAKSVKHTFTLVEALVAAVLLALAAAAIISLLVFHFRFSHFLDQKRVVSQVATSRIEVLCEMEFDDITLADETNVRVNEDGIPTADGAYLRSTTLTTEADGGVTITVRVESPGDSIRTPAVFELVTQRYE